MSNHVLTPTTITTPADKTPAPDTDTDTALAGFCLHGGHLPTAAAKWLAGLRSEHTRAAYRRDLGVFHTWMRDHLGHTDLSEVEVGDLEAFVAHQRHHGRSRTTIARRLSTLSALYRRLMVTGHVATNPAHPDLIPRGDATPDTPTRWVDGIDLQPLLALADRRGPDQTLTNPRTALILRLLTLSGLRASEVGWLRLDDVREGPHGCLLRVRGKGGQVDHVDLDQPTCDALDEWLDRRTQILHRAGIDPTDPDHPLVVTQTGTAVSRQVVADVVGRATHRALGRRLSPHSLRRSMAVALHRAGHSDRDLQRWGRWRALSTVGVYTRVADDDGHPGLVAGQVIASARPHTRRAPAGRLRRTDR